MFLKTSQTVEGFTLN